jgi:hypothetical protein
MQRPFAGTGQPLAGQRYVVVGEGAVAKAVAAAAAQLPGVAQVRVQHDFAARWQGVHAVLDVSEGVSGNFAGVMQTLSQGVPVFTANRVLLAVHGAVLVAAASGQCTQLGMTAASVGWPVPLDVPRISSLTMRVDGAAQRMLQRMQQRDEDATQARTALLLRGQDVSDEQGKHTLARAVVLHAQWQGQWLPVRAVRRQSLGANVPWKALQPLGLTVVFGAVLKPMQVWVGPLAVPVSQALGQALAQPENPTATHVWAETAVGPLHWQWPGGEAAQTQAVVAGLLHDVTLWRQGWRAAQVAPAPVLARGVAAPVWQGPWVQWQSGQVQHGMGALPEGAVPVVGAWSPPAASTVEGADAGRGWQRRVG